MKLDEEEMEGVEKFKYPGVISYYEENYEGYWESCGGRIRHPEK